MSFTYKGTFVIDHTKVPSTQTDFPVLISVTDNSLKTIANGGQMQSSSGFDFRPYSDTGLSSALTYQLHFYDGTAGTIVLRVLIASLSSAVDTTIYCGFGDSGLSSDGSSRVVWDSSVRVMLPLSDGTTLNVNDFANQGPNNGTNNAGVTATSGKVDGAAAFVSASSQYVSIANETDFDVERTDTFTVSLWMNFTAGSGNQTVFSKVNTSGNGAGISLIVERDNDRLKFSLQGSGVDLITGSTPLSSITGGTFHHVLVTYDGSSLSTGVHVYINGVDQTLTGAGTLVTSILNDTSLRIANDPYGGVFYDGKIDEFRFAFGVVRSQNWATTEYNNENSPAVGGFYTSITFGAANIPRYILGTH